MLVQCLDQQDAHTDPVGGGERRQDRIADQEPAEPGALGLGVDRQATHQHGRHGIGCVAAKCSGQGGVLDGDG